MIDHYVRKHINVIFEQICSYLPANVTPAHLTLSAFIFGLAAACALSFHYSLLSLFFLWLSGLCDIFDGTVARATNSATVRGAHLDLIADRMVEAALILGFTCAYPEHYLAYILFLIALLLHFSTFLAAAALFKNTGLKSVHYEVSLIERPEAFCAFSLFILFPSYIFPLFMLFNGIIFFDALARFFRILNHKC